MTELLPCKCGGTGKLTGHWTSECIKCDSCDYETAPYYDGVEYAMDDWNRRQLGRETRIQEIVVELMRGIRP